MNIEEKFVFDLEGYIVIKGVLSPDEVAELNDLAVSFGLRATLTPGQSPADLSVSA